MSSFSSLSLALAGYDFPSASVLQWRAQISYDDSAHTFQVLLTASNTTSYNFLNYFIMAVSQDGSAFFAITNACLGPFASYNPNTYITVQPVGQFYKSSNNTIIGVPFLKSIQSTAPNSITTLTLSPITFVTTTNLVTIKIFNDNLTALTQVCLTVLLYHQTAAQSDPFIAFSYSSFLMVSSGSTSSNLNAAATNSFNIGFQYGPVLEPKCLIGIQGYQLASKVRQSMSFNISQGGVTQRYASSNYSVSFGYFCVAAISCGEGMQYYPVLNDCELVCNISMCLVCQSSTSCTVCSAGNFVNPLLRCSPCPSNCNNCSSVTNCTLCAPGFFLNASGCNVCPIFCTSCTAQTCNSCQGGFLPSGNQCLSCGGIMTNCLTCTAPSVCSLCLSTYYFNSNQKACVLCNTTMPNCYTCDLPNNCLTCYPSFYLAAYNKCSPCNPSVAVCCSGYVPNCALCGSNTTCSKCTPSYYLNSDKGCTSCGVYDGNCNACSKEGCLNCVNGYYLSGNTCLLCSNITGNCTSCDGLNCLTCNGSLLLADGQCLDCPFWPLNGLLFLNTVKTCRPCSEITPNCKLCLSNSTCTACQSLYYLADGACGSCQESIPSCLTCSGPQVCLVCQSGYYLSLNSSACLSCNNEIPNCGQCGFSSDGGTEGGGRLSCQICLPEYFHNNSACSSCLVSIPNCLQCPDSTSCSLCAATYFLNPKQQCVNCSSILPGCRVCLSKEQCSACLDGFYLEGEYCTACNTASSNCQQCSKGNGTVLCSQCAGGYFLDPFLNCAPCAPLFTNCQACTLAKCTQCISGFYIAANRSCTPCSSAISNCAYCSQDMQCQFCKQEYWLNPNKNTCESCFDLSRGCTDCQRISELDVNCSECVEGFSLYPSSKLLFTCLECNVTMKYCRVCLSASVCLNCTPTTFLNQYGTCSLCSLYITSCQFCSSASQCTQCSPPFLLTSSGGCISCDLSQFGSVFGTSLCTECGFVNAPVCTACINGYYVNSQQSQCLSCNKVIYNCASCISEATCLTCLPGFMLSSSNSQCKSCSISNCEACSDGVCQKCMPGSYLLAGGSKCSQCNDLIGGCNSCTPSACLACADGYYFSSGNCITCSSAIANCIICSDAQNCILKLPPPPNQTPESPLMKPFAIGMLILSALLLIGLLLWERCTGKPRQSVLQEEMPKFQTDRRINSDQVYSNEVALQRGKVCQQCRSSPSEVMRLELLCSQCEQILRRGHRHKIRKEMRKKEKCGLPAIEEEQELQLESKMEEKSKSLKRQEGSNNEGSVSKRAATKTTNDLESIALRNLF